MLKTKVPDNNNEDRFSLPAFNVQRGRDHGIPGYAAYRKLSGKEYPYSWDDISTDVMSNSTKNALAKLYESPEDVDLWMGLISEIPDPKFLLPPTQRCNIRRKKKAFIFNFN